MVNPHLILGLPSVLLDTVSLAAKSEHHGFYLLNLFLLPLHNLDCWLAADKIFPRSLEGFCKMSSGSLTILLKTGT